MDARSGIKIAAGKIEKDLEYCVFAEPDFITIDGRGGATGASPAIVRDSTSVPTIYALYRARRYLDSVKSDISLVITGGLRVSSDFAKAIAMGADAVAVASAAMVAAACQQYRICGSGMCPVGVATPGSGAGEKGFTSKRPRSGWPIICIVRQKSSELSHGLPDTGISMILP